MPDCFFSPSPLYGAGPVGNMSEINRMPSEIASERYRRRGTEIRNEAKAVSIKEQKRGTIAGFVEEAWRITPRATDEDQRL